MVLIWRVYVSGVELGRLNQSWVILGAGFVVMFFSGGSRFALGLMLKPMTEDMGWTRSSLSAMVTVFMIVSALVLPLTGRLADRFSLRFVMVAGGLLVAAGVSLMGQATALWHVFLAYGIIFAVGHAGTSQPVVGVMISRWFSRRRGIATSAAISGNAIGQLVIIGLLAAFLTQIGWRNSCTVLGAAALLIPIPLVLFVVKSRPPVRPGGEESQVATSRERLVGEPAWSDPIRSSRRFWLLVGVYAACGFQDFFVVTHVVAFALDLGVTPLLAGNMLAWMGLVGLVGVLTSGVMADAYGPARPAFISFVMRAVIFAFIIYFQSTAAIVAFALMYGLTFLVTSPLTVIFAGNLFGPARLGTVSGLLSMVHQVSAGGGALVGAMIFDYWGSYDRAFMLMFVLAFVAMGLMTLGWRKPDAVLRQPM